MGAKTSIKLQGTKAVVFSWPLLHESVLLDFSKGAVSHKLDF